MAYKVEYPTHPGVPSAMNISDVAPNVDFVAYQPGNKIVMEGTFTSSPEYDENDFKRWTATARKLGETADTLVSLTAIGLARNDDGEWSDVVTIPRD